jgi:prolyl oligopeptidase PreP (S9A serine peptidase family)
VYWDKKSSGFYYSGSPSLEEELAGARGKRLKYRSILRPRRPDFSVFENPEWPNYADYGLCEVEAGRTYLAYRVQGAAEIPLAAYFGQGRREHIDWTPLYVSSERTLGRFVTVHGNKALFRASTLGDKPASRFGVVAVELVAPFRRHVLVPEDPRHVLIQAQQIGEFLALHYITPELTNRVRFADLTGQTVSEWIPTQAGLPSYGTLSSFAGDGQSRNAYFTYESIATPPHMLTVDLTDCPKVTAAPPSSPAPVSGSPVTYERLDYPSVDKTRIPIQIMTRSDTPGSPSFAYLYFYGAIGLPTFPAWNTTFQMILELGGAVVIASIRGGGERGIDWQSPDIRLNRQRTLEDIATAARWLKGRYRRVVIAGRSYGGMHTLASMAQAQADAELFVAQMPVSDVPEFLDNGVFGRSAWDDFGFPHNRAGDLLTTADAMDIVKRWSPLQNIPRLTKPLLLVTADKDERVEPATQVDEMALALQDVQAPVYLHVQPGLGHDAPVDGAELAFIARHLGIGALHRLF